MPLKHTVKEIVLKNGARGLLIDVPDSTVVAYDFYFNAGNEFVENKDAQQTAHLMEHLAFTGTERFPSIEEFSQEFEKNGAYHNAITYPYDMRYLADCADFEWERILKLQLEAMAKPMFKQEVLDTEKGNVTEELTGYMSNHGRVLWQELNSALGSPSFKDAEKLATVQNVTLDDVKAHHAYTHTTKNVRFCIAGNLATERDAIVSLLENWNLPKGERLEVKKIQLHRAKPVRIYRKELQSVIFNFTMALNRELDEPEQDAMNILNHILTGSHHSRILGKARSAGICYGMGSGSDVELDGYSDFSFRGQIRPQNAPALMRLIVDELTKVRNGEITDEELEAAKLFTLGEHQMGGQTVRSIAGWYAGYYAGKGKIAYIDDAPDEIRAVKRETIQRLLNEFLEAGIWVVGVIGDISNEAVAELDEIVAPLFSKGVK